VYTLGICAPYRRTELTLGAIRLADLGRELAMDVRFIPAGKKQNGVDYVWDRRVRCSSDFEKYATLHSCTHFVWFSCDAETYSKCKLVAPKARHWFVPSSANKPESFLKNGGVKNLVCPSRSVKKQVENALQGSSEKVTTWCLWDSGWEAVLRDGLLDANKVSIYVPMLPKTIDQGGNLVLQAIKDALDLFPEVHFTLESHKSWPKSYRRFLQKLKCSDGERVSVRYLKSFYDQPVMFHSHDWTWLPDVQSDLGIVAQRSLACGTPVIAYKVSPFVEFVSNENTGMLIPCESSECGFSRETASPSLVSVVSSLAKVITGGGDLLSACQDKMWKRESQHMQAFKAFWAAEWDLSSVK
jgi:glycosyltransferase involved in cell wall biosynthesis